MDSHSAHNTCVRRHGETYREKRPIALKQEQLGPKHQMIYRTRRSIQHSSPAYFLSVERYHTWESNPFEETIIHKLLEKTFSSLFRRFHLSFPCRRLFKLMNTSSHSPFPRIACQHWLGQECLQQAHLYQMTSKGPYPFPFAAGAQLLPIWFSLAACLTTTEIF